MPGVLKKTMTTISLITSVALIAITAVAPANAQLPTPRLGHISAATGIAQNVPVIRVGDRRHGGGRHYRRGNNNDAAIVGGIVGLATGLIIGGTLNQPAYNQRDYNGPDYGRSRTYYNRGYRPRRHYSAPPRVYYAPPPPVYRERYAAWSPEWYTYCARKYRSFNPRTGYFLAYSGKYHFCR